MPDRVFAALIPAPIFAMVPKHISLGQVGLGYGILSTCLNIGILLGPLLVGFLMIKHKTILPDSILWQSSPFYRINYTLIAIFKSAKKQEK